MVRMLNPCVYGHLQGRTRRCLQVQAPGISFKIQFRRKEGGSNRNRTSSACPCLPQSYIAAVNRRNATLAWSIGRRKGGACIWQPAGRHSFGSHQPLEKVPQHCGSSDCKAPDTPTKRRPSPDRLKLQGGARNLMSAFDEGDAWDLAGHLLWTAANAASLTTPSFIRRCTVNGVPS